MEYQFKKIWLNINGGDRMIVCNPEKDSLSDVLRRIGLTGVKIGCGSGVCGVCSVILDGKVVRSCTKKMKNVNEFSKIITVEGIGNPMHLHPLQKAFMKYGSIQCGICTPGFIVSAYQLLSENNNPTREEVREWFSKNKNYCRCTGYKQIVDAVMEAAKVIRGEADEKELDYNVAENKGRYYNSHMPRPSALGKVTGTIDYGEDVSLKMPDGLLHAAIVQPRVTRHANIISIDTSEAEKMPGVVKVITGKDVKGSNMIDQYPYGPRARIYAPTREIICTKKIKRFGDVIALVVADTRDHAREAAKFVKMEYEQLPEYIGKVDALQPDAISIQDGFPNVYHQAPCLKGEDAQEVIDKSKYSIEGSFSVQHQPHLSIEGDAIVVYEDEDGMLSIQCKSQSIYGNHALMGKSIGHPGEKIRILQHGAVGASFGWSVDMTSQALAAIACLATEHPVSLVMSWEEHNHYCGKRTSAVLNGSLACDENGKLTAIKYEVGANHGAYVEFSDTGNYLRAGTPYVIPNVRAYMRMFSSNNNHCTAWRGFGMPQTITFTETMMDMLAEKAGIDPFEFRYNNIMRENDRSVNGSVYDNADQLRKLMDMARPYYNECKESAKQLSTDTLKYGAGVSLSIFFPTMGAFDKASASIEIKEDNRFHVHNTYHEMGQGGDICTMISALESLKELNLKPEDVQVDINDSKYCPDSGISAQSRSFVMNCGAINEAAKLLLEAMKKPDGTYRTYEEMVAENIPTLYEGLYTLAAKPTMFLGVADSQGEIAPTPVFAVNIAKVCVDTQTGKTKTVSYRMWSDCGVIGNYLGAEGQAFGGVAQNVGYALSEDYDDTKKSGNPISCGLPNIADVPDDLEITWLEDRPRENTPFGSNGLSECFFAGQNYAILSGIYDATGVRIYESPAYAEKVKEGIDKLARGEEITPPEKYYLGVDFDDMMDEFANNPIKENWKELQEAAAREYS